MERTRIAVGPSQPTWAVEAVEAGSGEVADAGDDKARGLIWLDVRDPEGLKAAIAQRPSIEWVQLVSAGVEAFIRVGAIDHERRFTSAKGSNAKPVAEHALTLALSSLRRIPERARARSWGKELGDSLYGEAVTILGGGSIARSLLGLLAPFDVEATVVRRRVEPVEGASRVVATKDLHAALDGTLVVFVALALTPETIGIVDADALGAMDERAHLVNVARGRHVVTDALVDALESGSIAAAALDVTDPEPLPDGHRLWSLENALITPHSANPASMARPLMAERIRANTERFLADEPLIGLVDPDKGY